jgi:hypothetical protein
MERAMFTPYFSLSAKRNEDPVLEVWRGRIGAASIVLTVLYFIMLAHFSS